MWTEASLKDFGRSVQRLLQKEDLTREETYDLFRQVLENRQPDLHQGAFLAALAAKGETAAEIAGAWQAIVEHDTCRVEDAVESPLVENCGTGMDGLKTFNVSTAAAVVAAAGGARVARHGSRALTSSCGTVDLLETVGVDVECSVAAAARSVREAGIGLFNGMSPKVHPRALFRMLSQIRFGSTLNIAASLASPCRPTHALRGVYSDRLLAKVAGIMKEIGYQRAMVVHGFDEGRRLGMDELSTCGESVVEEFFPDGSSTGYTLAPEDVGLRRVSPETIAPLRDRDQEAVRFVKILGGAGDRPCADIVALNAGAMLYLINRAFDIEEGVLRSREIIESGAALDRLCRWVSVQGGEGGRRRLTAVADRAGLGKPVREGFERCGG